jgi:hypothetical protein
LALFVVLDCRLRGSLARGPKQLMATHIFQVSVVRMGKFSDDAL